MTLKVCFVCDQMKDTAEFTKDRSKLDGLHPNCKPCLNAKKWLMRRRKGIPERPVFVDSDTHKTCRQCHTQIPVADFGRHPSQCKGCMALRSRDYRERHPDKARAAFKAWVGKADSSYFVLKEAKRRRRIEENGKFDVSRRDLSRLMHRQRHQCAVCQASLVAASHLDHVIPVSRGGRHSIGNFQYLCPPCNLRKSNMFMSEFKLRIGGD